MKTEKEEPLFKVGSYAWFHFANKGKEFVTKKGVRSKLDLFVEFSKNTLFLKELTSGKANGFQRVDKDGWVNGCLINKDY